jgi:GTP 3',8-cyclase
VTALKYLVDDGRILTRSLEVHVVDHCNLRCKECCTLSPFLPESVTAPEEILADLELARRVLRPETVKISGGEPLLHPRLADVLRAAKQSGLAERVSVTTNGHLLHKMPEACWEALDQLTLSLYPSAPLAPDRLEMIRARCREHGIELREKRQDAFEELTVEDPQDGVATARAFERCWMKRRCHMLRRGVFYTCTRPPHFDTYFHAAGRFAEGDGVRLHGGPGMLRDLLCYLERDEPLASCRHCLGNTGRAFPHEQLRA